MWLCPAGSTSRIGLSLLVPVTHIAIPEIQFKIFPTSPLPSATLTATAISGYVHVPHDFVSCTSTKQDRQYERYAYDGESHSAPVSNDIYGHFNGVQSLKLYYVLNSCLNELLIRTLIIFNNYLFCKKAKGWPRGNGKVVARRLSENTLLVLLKSGLSQPYGWDPDAQKLSHVKKKLRNIKYIPVYPAECLPSEM